MDKVELFSIPDITFYNPPKFREYLVENYDSSQVDHDLTIIVGITKHNKMDFFEALQSFGFTTVRNLGSVFHIRFELDEAPLECYVTHDADTGVVIFYTNYRKTKKKEIPIIRDFLSSDVNTYYLFFKPSLMREIAEELMELRSSLLVGYPILVFNPILDRTMIERLVIGEMMEEKHFRNWGINMEYCRADLS